MKVYDVNNWYWIVGGDQSQVFSSAVGNFVPSSDPTYTAWGADGTQATRIGTLTELGAVLADSRVRPIESTVLDAYKEQHADQITIKLVAKILLWCVNEIRTLKGQTTLSAAQFKAFIKGQM